MSPRVVIGAPLFNKAGYLESAARSILAQSYGDLALLLIDDCSTDETVAVARALAAEDPRVEVVVNERRLGMLGNTNRAFTLARERFPQAEFWALGSDHDVWHERWLETLVGLLDEHPDAVLAYPQTRRIDEDGVPYPRRRGPWRFDTAGIADPRERFRATFRGMVAGDMIYALFRARVLDERGALYRPVLVPDRLTLTELALAGPFVQADEVLWERRFRGLADLERQRRAFFLDAAPRSASAPWWLAHTAEVARHHGAGVAREYLGLALALRYRRRLGRVRRRVRRYAPRRLARRALGRLSLWVTTAGRRRLERLLRRPRFRRWAAESGAPALRRTADILEQPAEREREEAPL